MSWGLEHVSVWFGNQAALQDVTLDINQGDIIAIVGGDGAGKSTLLKVLAGRVTPTSGLVRNVAAPDLGMQPETSGVWPNLTVDENVAFVRAVYGSAASHSHQQPSRVHARTHRNQSAEASLTAAGLDHARDRLGRKLSGGMRQKLGVVLAADHDPQLLLLDEPSTGVDPVSRVELWRLMTAAARRGAAVVFSTTYVDEAARADTMLILDHGLVVGQGEPDDIHIPGQIAVNGDADGNPDANSDTFKWRRGRTTHEWLHTDDRDAQGPHTDADLVTPDLEDIAIVLSATGGLRHPAAPISPLIHATRQRVPQSQTCAALQHVTKKYGHHAAIHDVSLRVASGEIIGLIGANGAGKTTSIRQLLGLETPSAGSVQLLGAAPARSARAHVGYVPQSMGIFMDLTVAENVAFTAQVFGVPVPDVPDVLKPYASSLCRSLGLGIQRQLAFFLALLHHPEFLVLDEPTSGVSPLARAALWSTIHSQASQGVGVLVSTHYLQEAEQCTRIIVMNNGRVMQSGTLSELIADATVLRVRTHELTEAMQQLDAHDIPYTLDNRSLPVPNVSRDALQRALGSTSADIDNVAAQLDEVLLANAQAPSHQ